MLWLIYVCSGMLCCWCLLDWLVVLRVVIVLGVDSVFEFLVGFEFDCFGCFDFDFFVGVWVVSYMFGMFILVEGIKVDEVDCIVFVNGFYDGL